MSVRLKIERERAGIYTVAAILDDEARIMRLDTGWYVRLGPDYNGPVAPKRIAGPFATKRVAIDWLRARLRDRAAKSPMEVPR